MLESKYDPLDIQTFNLYQGRSSLPTTGGGGGQTLDDIKTKGINMASFKELESAAIAAFDAGDEERALNLKEDALQAKQFEDLESQALCCV